MKNLFLIVFLFTLASCNSMKKYSDFDYSYSRSGGYDPIYENFQIKGNNGFYSFEGKGEKTTKNFKISDRELQILEQTISTNNFRMIEEDHKKIYDRISTSIYVKNGSNSGRKSDASLITTKDQERWKNIVDAFQNLLNSKLNNQK